MDHEKLVLGIDIGTSSVKISLMDPRTLKSVYAKSVLSKAKIISSHKDGDEQDVIKIIEALRKCLQQPSGDLMKKVNLATRKV